MTNDGALQIKAARVAGAMYVFTIILGILYMSFIDTRLVVPGDATMTANNILANELLFRIGVAGDLILFACVVVLSLGLYLVLREVHRGLALLALLWRLTEAIIGVVAVLVASTALMFLSGDLAAFEQDQLHTMVGLSLNLRAVGVNIAILFCSLGSIVYFSLFLKSRYVHKLWSMWGLVAYTLLLIYSFAVMIVPDHAENVILQVVCYLPGALFELIFGLRLLFRGVNVE